MGTYMQVPPHLVGWQLFCHEFIGAGEQNKQKTPTQRITQATKDIKEQNELLKLAEQTVEQLKVQVANATDATDKDILENDLLTAKQNVEGLTKEIDELKKKLVDAQNDKAEQAVARDSKAKETAASQRDKAVAEFRNEFPGAGLEQFEEYMKLVEKEKADKKTFLELKNPEEAWELFRGLQKSFKHMTFVDGEDDEPMDDFLEFKNTEAAWELFRGVQNTAEMAVRKKRANEVFDEHEEGDKQRALDGEQNIVNELWNDYFGEGWLAYKSSGEFKSKMASSMKFYFERAIKKLQTEAEKLGKLLGKEPSSKGYSENVEKLSAVNWDIVNTIPLMQKEIQDIDFFEENVKNREKDSAARSKFMFDFVKTGVLLSDWPAYKQEQKDIETQKQTYLQQPNKSNDSWLYEFGNRLKAETKVRQGLDDRENAFDNWKELKKTDDMQELINIEESKEIGKQITSVKAIVTKAETDVTKEKDQHPGERTEKLLQLELIASVKRAARDAILPSLEARKVYVDEAKNRAKTVASQAVKDAKEEAKRAAREAKEAEATVAKEAREAASQAAKEAREAKQAEAAAAKEAKAAERAAAQAETERLKEAAKEAKAAERAAAQAETERLKEAAKAAKAAERAAAQAETERLKEEAKKAKEAAREAKREEARAKALAKQMAKEAKAAERAKEYDDTLELVKQMAEDLPAQMAAAFIMLDSKRERQQAKFDRITEDTSAKDPPQKRKQRGKSSLGLAWPVCQIPLTPQQHAWLFFSEDEWDKDDASSDGGTPFSMPPTPGSTAQGTPAFAAQGTPAGAHLAEAAALSRAAFDECGEPRLDAMFADCTIGGETHSPQARRLADIGASFDHTDVLDAEPLIFNKPYARRLLKEHLEALYTIHGEAMLKNEKAKYVNVWSSLGDIRDGDVGNKVLDDLIVFWEQMLRYRNTMIKSKQMQLEQDLELIQVLDSGRTTELEKELASIKKLGVRSEWIVEARRVVEADRGQLPGQLYSPQPHFLPLRIAAPPRVGKSATALLAATLAKRAGMVCLYSVAPHKTTPIAEAKEKLMRVGWMGVAEARRMDYPINKLLKEQSAQNPKYTENEDCMRMEFRTFVIDDVPGKASTSKPLEEPDPVSNARPDPSKIDMVFYSSQVAEDIQRVGALLSDWRRRNAVVFHIRDEVQTIAKAIDNKLVPNQKHDIPPNIELQYLRHYYGNLYGLNCNVSATHFPTLIEEEMWGFMGSIEQNSNAGLKLEAKVGEIRAQIGSFFLPKLIPALLPYVSPGYIGVKHLRTWEQAGVKITLEDGADHSAVDKETKQLRALTSPVVQPAATGGRGAGAAAPSTRLTRGQRAELQRKAMDGGLTEDEVKKLNDEELAQAQKSLEQQLLESYLPTPDPPDSDEEGDNGEEGGGDEAMPDAAAATTREGESSGGKRKAAGDDSDFEPNEEDDDEDDEEEEKPKKKKKGKKGKPGLTKAQREAKKAAELKEAQRKVAKDAKALQDHFAEWLDAEEADVNRFRSNEVYMDGPNQDQLVDSPDQPTNPEEPVHLVPMYISAISAEVVGTGSSSFIRTYSQIAHRRALAAGVVGKNDPVGSESYRSTRKAYGVAMVLFTGKPKNRAFLKEANIEVGNPEGQPIPKFGNAAGQTVAAAAAGTAEADEEDEKDEDKPITSWADVPLGCNAPPRKERYTAVCCVYDPLDGKNAKVKKDGLPALQVFFCTGAASAIDTALQNFNVTKIAVMGYDMLQAGLTLQHAIPTKGQPTRVYCPQYVALGVAEGKSLDGQLQIVGRSFVELKGIRAPMDWKIALLSVDGMVDRMNQYSDMEDRLARIKGVRLFEALKDGFGATLMATNSKQKLGTVGVREGDFGAILGLTPAEALRRAKAAEDVRRKRAATTVAKKQLTDEEKAAQAAEEQKQLEDAIEADKVLEAAQKLEREEALFSNPGPSGL